MCKEEQISAVSTLYRSDRCGLRDAREIERMSRSTAEHRSMSVVSHEHSRRGKSLARPSDRHGRLFEKSSSTPSHETNQTTAETRPCRTATRAARANEQFETTKEVDRGQMKPKRTNERQISLTSIFSIHLANDGSSDLPFVIHFFRFVEKSVNVCDVVIL